MCNKINEVMYLITNTTTPKENCTIISGSCLQTDTISSTEIILGVSLGILGYTIGRAIGFYIGLIIRYLVLKILNRHKYIE